MITDYLIVSSAVATATLLWRTLLNDHPVFDRFIRSIPAAGNALTCGFCSSLWFSLVAALVANPLLPWQPVFASDSVIVFIIEWFAVGAGVLCIRNVLLIFMELGAVLSHEHRHRHQN